MPTLSRIPYSLIGCASSLWLFFDGSAGIEAAADRFPALPAAALTVQAVVTVDNGGLAPTFALLEGRISPKAGIIKSLKIPNSSNTSREFRHALAHYLIWYKKINGTTPHSGKTSALVGHGQDTSTIDIITNNINGSTMTGGSR